FLVVVGMVGHRFPNDEQRLLIHRRLDVEVLVKTIVFAVFHDPGVGIGEVVLVFVPGAGSGRCRRLAPRLLAGALLLVLALAHFSLILGPFGGFTLRSSRQKSGFGLGQTGQAVFSASDLLGQVHA